MKIKKLRIENFRCIKELEHDFTKSYADEPRPVTAVIGDNGSGKTSVLQAVAWTLSLATHPTSKPENFGWPGFMAERVGTLGPSRVSLDIVFEVEELRLTQELWRECCRRRAEPRGAGSLPEPSVERLVTLVNQSGWISSSHGVQGVMQFQGRSFLQALLPTEPGRRPSLARLGDVFWFDQQRDLPAAWPEPGNEDGGGGRAPMTERARIGKLREFLISQFAYRHTPLSDYGPAAFERLQQQFAALFPGVAFHGVLPRGDRMPEGVETFYVMLKRGDVCFDIEEMSSGERTVFPLLLRFIQQDIGNSVVLVDELELHLHPPEQQALLGALRQLGPDCQFIFTTHSDALAGVIPREHTIRLPGGRLCL